MLRTASLILLLVIAACGASSGGAAPPGDPSVVERVPQVVQVDGLFTLASAPAPRACTSDADCVGDTVPAKDLCCQDPLSVVPHSRAWSTWIAEWRTRSCASHTCPPPPNPAQPPACLFAVTCQNQRCENACPG